MTRGIKHASIFSMTLLALTISGCETARINDAAKRAEVSAQSARGLASDMRNRAPSQEETVRFTDEPWVSTKPIAQTKGLPPALDCSVAYNERKSLQQFAEWVMSACGVAVKIAPDALDGGASLARSAGGSTSGAPNIPPPPMGMGMQGISDLFPGGGSPGAAFRSPQRSLHATRYEGKLSGLLDTITGGMGLSWRYEPDENAVRIFYYETRVFHVYTLNQTTAFNSTVRSGMTSNAGVSGGSSNGSSSSGVSGDSGSTQTTTTDINSSIANDIESTVRSMLTLDKMSYSKATGVISITDRPDVLDRVKAYIDQENASITKQVLFNFEILSVSLNDKDQYGIDWDLVYQSEKFGFGLKNSVPGISSAAVGGSFSILDTGSPWAASKALIQALSEQGTVFSRSQPSVTTLNLQAAPVQIGRVKGFLASSQTTNTSDAGSSTALTPGSITSGFNMSLLPFVMPDNRMLLKLTVSMIGNPEFETFTSGDSSIQNPDYSLQIFDQNVKLKSGQTLVISGFDQTMESTSKSGTGTSGNFLFGGGGKRDSSREVTILMITPVILE